MFNFNLDGKEKVAKPMRSKIEFDANGKATATIYADEYDLVKNIPDFQDRISAAGRNMAIAQDSFADEMQEARIQAVEKRIQAKKQEAVSAELAASEAAGTGNEYPGIDILGRMIGSKTFAQRSTSRQEELRRLLEQRAALEGTPEISAPMTEVSEPIMQAEPVAAPVAPVQQAPVKKTVKVKNPDGVVREVPSEVWSSNAKRYIEQGYQLMP